MQVSECHFYTNWSKKKGKFMVQSSVPRCKTVTGQLVIYLFTGEGLLLHSCKKNRMKIDRLGAEGVN
jgi:hypothetical protein